MDVDGPCSDITLNMRDMRRKFGYTTLYEMAAGYVFKWIKSPKTQDKRKMMEIYSNGI